ncbi:hypothetical protein E3N88_30721 [Mikania micrantha]|uniref:RING-type domain-containing protein n=1 Tax=Mikania micrantha TaxID=192012 RepID=A0A5N6MPN8_9ASTR|nr:hypothetical protein E3N88_30721 [Mikania micrantha]
MAVQAQCSSIFLHLNRTLQEGTTVLEHQLLNHTLLNSFPVANCNTNQRKRGREDNMNQFISNIRKKQSHCNQLLDVSQIESRNIDVSTGLRLAFNGNQQQHSIDHQPYGFVSLLSEDLSKLSNHQGDEIESYLHAQGEELRRQLAEKRKRHYSALIGAAKEAAERMIREKEALVVKAVRRNAELEARVLHLSAETEVWQARAMAQEAVAVALQAELQQTVVAGVGGCVSPGEEVAGGEAEDAESSYVDPERVVVLRGPGCKACGKRVASVVLLPCRHLCVCSECDDVVQVCPLCLSFRSSSIEVYMS